MTVQRENAEIVQEIIRSAMKLDATLREYYKNINIDVQEEKDGSCVVNVSPLGIARCKTDGTIFLLNHPDTMPYVGEVPVMLPIDRDSFALAMLYLTDLNYLHSTRKKRYDRMMGVDIPPDDFGSKGFGGSGGILS